MIAYIYLFLVISSSIFAIKAPRKNKHKLSAAFVFVVLFYTLQTFFITLSYVPTGSMNPTIPAGGLILIDRTSGADIRLGEVYVFSGPEIPLVKRALAGPGDLVEARHGRVWVNGVEATGSIDNPEEVLFNPYDARPPGCEYRDGGITCEIPVGHYFMVGDNRANSLDSRYFGPVSEKSIEGRVIGL